MSDTYQFELPLTAEVVEEILQQGYIRRNDPRFEAADEAKLNDLPTAAELNALLDNKVDKVAGKGLSDENYTAAEKTQLATLDATADMDKPVSTAQAAAINALRNYDALKILTKGSVSGAQDAVIANAAYIQLTCSAAVVFTFDLTGVKTGYAIGWTMEVTNGAEGLTFTNTIRWAGGAAPTLSAQTDVLRFIYNGTDIIADKIIDGA